MSNKTEKAREVIYQAKELGVFQGPIPEAEQDLIKSAKKLVDYANSAYKEGNRSNNVVSILRVAGIKQTPTTTTNVNSVITYQDPDEIKYQEAIDDSPESGLPVPHEIEGDVPKYPEDLTTQTDRQIRYLHGAFNACAARTGFLLSQQRAGELAAKQIADYYYEQYIISADRVDDQTKKPKTIELLKAEALNNDSRIAKWRGLQNDHKIKAQKLETLYEIYVSNVSNLSREMTLRQMEREGMK